MTERNPQLPTTQPIECEAQPLDRPRARQSADSNAGTFVLAGFFLVLLFKIIGLLIIAFWLARRFPKTVMTMVAAIPAAGTLRKRLAHRRD
jgi:hypothetical protein